MLDFLKDLFNKKELDNPVFCENCYYFSENRLNIEKCNHKNNLKYYNSINYKKKGKTYGIRKPCEINKYNNCSWYSPKPPNSKG